MKKITFLFILAITLFAGCSKPAAQPCYECIDKVANTVRDTVDYCNGNTPYGTSASTLSNIYFYDYDGSNVDSTRCYKK